MAGRKEYELLFKLQATLGGNFNAAFKGANNTIKQLQNSMQKLHSVTGKIDAFKKQEAALSTNKQKLAELTAEHDRLQQEIDETEEPSEALRAAMAKNEKQIAQTTAKIEEQEARLQKLGGELSDAGVNTSRLEAENERLAKSYERVKKSQEELAKVNVAIQQNKQAITQTKTQLAGTIGTVAALGAALYSGPVKKAAEFEAQMSSVQAISGASGDELAKLSQVAQKMGATTQFTAVEAGKALEYMAMAGWKTNQMIGGLPGIMNLAAASGEDLGAVSDIVTDALTAFRMDAGDAGRFADVLAQASSNANTNVAMMGATFQKVAPVAGALGFSVEDMSLGIGLMANASIKADVAGTSLKTALANMAKPTKQMKSYMDKYGISLQRSDGSMKTFREVVDNLRDSLGGLSETEQVAAATAIFGKESFAGMLAIVNASNDDFQKLSNSINNSKGAAERMAKIKLNNFEGKVTLLKSALEGLQIAIGNTLLPTFTAGAEKAGELISKLAEFINQNPELVQQIIKITAGLLGFKAAALTAKLGFLELKGGVLNVQKGMALLKSLFALASTGSLGFSGTLKTVAQNVTGYFGGIGSAAGGVGRAFTGLFSGTKIGNLFSGMGGAVAGTFTKMFSGIGGMAAGAAGRVVGIFAKAGGTIAAGPLGKIGGVVASGFGKLTSMIAPLSKLGGAILGPFGGALGKILPVVGAVAAVVAVIQILRDNLDKVREVVGNVFGEAGLVVFDKVISVVSNVGEAIKNVFSEGNLAGARDFINGLFGEQGVAVFNTFISVIQTVGGVIREFISFVDTYVKPVIQELFSFIVTTVLPQIAQAFVTWGPTITAVIQGIWEVIQTVATAIMAVISALMPTIQSIISIGLETIKGVVSGVLTAIQGLLDVFAGIFTGNWTRVWEGVKSIFSGVWESIKSIAQGALNGIISIVNNMIGGLNSLKIPDWVPGVGGKGINIPLIPTFATGTARTPDSFIAGERGAELITNARNRTVYTAAQTDQLIQNNATMIALVPALQSVLTAWERGEGQPAGGTQGPQGRAGRRGPSGMRGVSAVVQRYATGTARTPDSFIAGERGAELITNARNRTVYTAAQTDQLIQNNATMIALVPVLQSVLTAWERGEITTERPDTVNAPTLSAVPQRQTSVVIHSQPVFHVGSKAEAEDIEKKLKEHDERLLAEFEDRIRGQEEDERRTTYD